ncbi:MAG TPA: DUF72 domain-containing protein [Candidatus Eremiobacteraceae bacterium]|nr:DUF72 domain-containing protein [Candidatus Eremiobacteraceae bacterium]
MIYVGTCGFSYKDWVGPFYPLGTKPADMLALYAGRFGAVEIDSTYYAIPRPSLFESMAKRTGPDFRFTVKAPGSITHAPVDGEPPPRDFSAFRACLEPLERAGKLGGVLVQVPGSFSPSHDAWRRLELIRQRWPGMPLVAEFRNRRWQEDDARERLRALEFGWCNVDEPRLGPLMRPEAEVTSPVGYVRFHGRNAAKWWKQDRSPAERYDYLYTKEQLVEWLPRIAEVSERTEQTYVFFNNHRNGQAATNARQMAALLGMTTPPQDERDDRPQLSIFSDGD